MSMIEIILMDAEEIEPLVRRQHLSTKAKDRPFKCDLCSKSFRRKCHLTRHSISELIVSGGRSGARLDDDFPFQCELCLKGFKSRGSVGRHIRYECEFSVDKPEFPCVHPLAAFGALASSLSVQFDPEHSDSSLEAGGPLVPLGVRSLARNRSYDSLNTVERFELQFPNAFRDERQSNLDRMADAMRASGRDRMRRYRARMKQDPLRYEEFKMSERERARRRRLQMQMKM
ncbi:unnamed protein product [Bemisia tabaci]|uniref:C2H2-type domain-containing protein n=1 Tax=Bemisia tabaci TaxID=7038 RepID=A0A9N9ZXI0_BEMTA|nr:unnamed protein product [Bemisia tabaci]